MLKLEWDSSFFEKNIYMFEPSANLSVFDSKGAELVYSKVRSDNYQIISKLCDLGFEYVEGELEFFDEIESSTTDDSNIRLARKDDYKSLSTLISARFNQSRFREPWFTANQREQFYAVWLKNAIDGSFDDACLLYEVDKTIMGFVTVKVDEDRLRIGLIGVNSDFQGKGIGSRLIRAAHRYGYSQKCKEIIVSTQSSNVQAVNLYIKNGFRLSRSNSWFYWSKQ
ncbi:MAG: GNAT family N-acetyltransferase [Oceanospirillaceae bacterium]|nr:GNAT family N-acetyltransferase [Oceanospirillaceae bacterium]